jgi:hypothetical protein
LIDFSQPEIGANQSVEEQDTWDNLKKEHPVALGSAYTSGQEVGRRGV